MSAAQDDDTRDGVWAPRFAPVAQIIPPNVFADMDVKVAAAVASGADVIDLAKGNPDAYPAEFIRDVAKSSVDDPLNARYTPFDGKPAFLQAAANWYRNVHGVELDWRSQLFAVEGAVDGLAGLFAILIDRGDAVAFADPYYPSYHCMSVMHGAEEILLPARAELGWLPDLDAVDESVWRRLRMLILNYPNNPTGAQAPACRAVPHARVGGHGRPLPVPRHEKGPVSPTGPRSVFLTQLTLYHTNRGAGLAKAGQSWPRLANFLHTV